jgi:hypothetical protein
MAVKIYKRIIFYPEDKGNIFFLTLIPAHRITWCYNREDCSRINKVADLRLQCFTSCLEQPCPDLFNTWKFVLLHLSNSILSREGTGLRYKWISSMNFSVPKIDNTMH